MSQQHPNFSGEEAIERISVLLFSSGLHCIDWVAAQLDECSLSSQPVSQRSQVCLQSPSLPQRHSFCVFFFNQSTKKSPPHSHCSVSTGILIENLFSVAVSECAALADGLIRWCNQKFLSYLITSLCFASSGNSPVLRGEAPDGDDHRHPAGLWKVQRRRLQVCFHNSMRSIFFFFMRRP